MAKSKQKLTPPPIHDDMIVNGKGTQAFIRYLLDLQRNTELESGDISELDIRVSKNEQDISSNESRISQNEIDIQVNSQRLDAHDVTLLDHESRITNNETSIADHEGRIDTLEAERTRWVGNWVIGSYPQNDMVQNDSILWIANKITSEEPISVGINVPKYLLPNTPTWNTLQHIGSVTYGMRITSVDKLFYISKLRFWINDISANYTYRYIIKDNLTGEVSLKNSYVGDSFSSVGWHEFVNDHTVLQNKDLSFLLLVSNSASDTLFNHAWVFTGTTQSDIDPSSGNANKINNNSRIRISKTDRDSIDRSAELAQAQEFGTLIRYAQESDIDKWQEWEVLGSTDNGTFIIYDTALINEGTSGIPDTNSDIQIYFIIPVPANTDYVELPAGVSSYPRAQGDIELSGGTRTYNENGYGVDLESQEFNIPDDWDIMGSFNV